MVYFNVSLNIYAVSGNIVGFKVGCAFGLSVGRVVGFGVGEVGAIVSPNHVGENEGTGVGFGVGEVGVAVGLVVGEGVGNGEVRLSGENTTMMRITKVDLHVIMRGNEFIEAA